jgi:lipopolysaccharide transport system permease protein
MSRDTTGLMENTIRYQNVAAAPGQSRSDAQAPVKPARTRTIIRPTQGWGTLDLHELWVHRDLVYFLVWRDIKVRYKQTALGAGWAILQPLVTMAVFSLFFGRLVRIPSDGIPYALFSYVGLVPWTFVANGLMQASNSLVGNSNLLTKVYFPRLAIPLAAVIAGILDFGMALLFAFGLMVYYRVAPNHHVFYLAFFILLSVAVSLGVSLWLAALHVQYRDVRYIVPFLLQFWMFATPIAYPSSLLTGWHRTLYGINPMVGVVEGFRWALLGANNSPGHLVLASCLSATAILWLGAYYFRRMERSFADIV